MIQRCKYSWTSPATPLLAAFEGKTLIGLKVAPMTNYLQPLGAAVAQ